MKQIISFLSLFSSFSTLLCCALPALLVSVGLGASLSSFLSVFPQITWVSEHKDIIFILAGILLFLSSVTQRLSADLACPTSTSKSFTNPENTCRDSKIISKYIFYFSVTMYVVGIFFAYLAPILF